VVDANRGPEQVDEGFPTWAIVVVVVVGMICLICVLYFVAFASMPPRRGRGQGDAGAHHRARVEAPRRIDFDTLKAQIYAELPRDASAIQKNYGNLNAVEAQRHRRRGCENARCFATSQLSQSAVSWHVHAPTTAKAPSRASSASVGMSSYDGVAPSSSANQYGVFPSFNNANNSNNNNNPTGSYGGVPENLKPEPVARPLPTMPASSGQYGLLSARSPRD
jgi:hypothetical protein